MENKQTYYLAQWLSGEMTEDEVSQYITPEELRDYKVILSHLEVADVPKMDISESYKSFWQKIQLNSNKPKTRIRRLISYSIAASVAILFGLGVYLMTPVTVHTRSGEQRNVALFDGTHIILNAGSTIKYSRNPFTARKVELIGEAYFEVTKGDKFTVIIPDGFVQVLGTKFNVMAWDTYLDVVCYEGKVKVRHHNEEKYLTKGKSIKSIQTGEMLPGTVHSQKAGWISGDKYFESVPLNIVIKSIENQYDYKISYNGIDTGKTFTGKISYKHLREALNTLTSLLNVKYDIDMKNKTVNIHP